MADSMEELQLSINQDFATKLRKQKEKAELDQLKQKFGDEAVDAEPESSSSESEDEDARELTSQKEKDFLKVLSMLKNKDPEIYEKESSFYHDDEKSSSEEERQESLKVQKPMYLKDYERKELLQRGSLAFISDEESDEESNEDKTEDIQDKGSPSYVEEQKLIKESFKEALEENDNEEEDFLKVREKTTEEKLQEDREYIDWLKGERSKLEKKPATQMEALRHYWMDPQLDEDEQFLRDYILDRNYIEKDSERIPTYAEIVGGDEEDEEEVEKQEEFERKFNFRFEEPDADFIKTYPRTVQGSVRKTDERRKEQRKSRESKKEKEKEQKREELKRLKNLKRKEIMEKLEKLKEITGNPNVGFREEDIEGDFDPKKYDEAMKNVFDEQFYEGDEGKKPVFEDDLNDEENWDEWEGEYGEHMDNEQQQTNGNYEPHYEDPGFNMDADFEENANNQNMEGFSEKKRKRGSRFALALAQKKPVFDPDEKTFEEYFDEYYKLDYEDIIGDTPCRFKYRQVAPNNFGLSTEEILACSDKELNQWVSVKKMSQYRSNSDEFKDLKKYRKRGQDEKTKKQILTSLQEKESAQEDNSRRKSIGKRANDYIPLAKKTRESSIPNETISVESEVKGRQNEPEMVSTNITETTSSKIDSKREEKTEHQKTVMSQEHRRSRFNQELQRRKAKQSNPKRKRLTFKELKEQAIKKRLQRQFRGAKKEQLNKLSAGRLASYGVLKKKKKKKKKTIV